MKKALCSFLLLLSVAIPATTMAQTMAALVGAPQQPASSDFSPKQTVHLKQLLNDLGNQFRVNILFEETTLPDIQVSSNVLNPNLKLDRQLNTLLKNYGLMYKKVGVNSYLIVPEKKTQPVNRVPLGNLESIGQPGNLFASSQAVSMALTVTGRVTDEQQQGLPGVSVVLKGTTQGTATDSDGKYSLTLPDGNGTLVFSFIGYLTEEVAVSNRTNIDVKLMSDIKSLSELVVVGYGTQQKKDVTGAISSISAKDFQAQPVTRLDQALQGRVPGVQVTSNSGAPGGDVKIRIRGANSIYGDNNPLYVVDGFIGADFRSVNPEDIESMQVLKDASATAVYGSRGANGVILITTKKGASGKMQVNLMSRFSTSEVLNTYDLLNAGEFAETANAARAAVNGGSPLFSTAEVNAFKQNGGTDWQKEIFRKATGMEYQLGMSGGSDKMNYYISGNYLDQEGIVLNSAFKRYALRANLTSQISDKFSVRLNLNAIRRENLNSQGNAGRLSPVTQALSWAPTTPVRSANGDILAKDPTGSIYQNPVALALERNYESFSTSSNVVGGFRYQILDGLSLDIGYGLNYENIQDQSFASKAASDNNQANASRGSYELINLQNVNNLTYTRVFNDVHHLTVTGVFEQQSYTLRGFGAQANNLTFPSLGPYNLALAESNAASTAYTRSTLSSFLGRVNYSFQDKYLITASVRRDGTSKFQGDNKYSVFPSIGLGWRVSEEGFMKDLDVLSSFKIRGGWGLTGNQAIPAYGTYSNYQTSSFEAFTPFNNSTLTPGILLGNIGNAGLKWETTEQINIGTDIELLKGSLAFSFDYFVKNTSDLLLNQPIAPYLGGGNIIKNVGNVQNKGIELSLNATPISTGAFTWNSAFNISFLDNKVVNLGAVDTLFTGSNVGSGLSSQSEFVLIEGQPLGSNWGLQYQGTWKPNEVEEAKLYGAKPGDSRYQDLNNDKQITTQDFQIIGRSQPKTSLGWNNTFTYKGLSLNIFIQSLLGFDKLNYTYGVTVAPTADVREYLHADIKDRYIPGVNETSDIPAFSGSNKTYYQSSRFIQQGDFIRLKNVSLSYTLPTTLVKSVGVQVFLTGTNLLTWTKYKGFDPESTSVGSGTDINQGIDYGSYPNSKTYVAGVRFQF
jgi:TonB-linked SusC/RagA family outer membrane protein